MFLSLCPSARLTAQVVLSEFQAANIVTLKDEDGDSEDWIELCNLSNSTVDVAGWYLTDDPGRLNKWPLPSTNLAAGQFIVIFASDKDRRVPGAPLHTNFKLSTSGEYLALVKPDGVTIATEYAPVFPPQAGDVSYGLPVVARTLNLLSPGASARFSVPVDGSDGTNWAGLGFNDATWLNVTTGVGFDYNGASVLVPVADSATDWSAEGVQGSQGWSYGYYNKATDTSPGYQTSDFVLFPRSAEAYGVNNFWNGSLYRWPSATAPWDTLGQTAVHPNGINNGEEHWVIRRWRSTTNGVLQARWRLYKTNPAGSGVTGGVYRNGVLLDAASIAGGDTTGVDRTVSIGEVLVGDVIDLVLTPVGPSGATDDGSDGSANMLALSRVNYMTNLMGSQVGSIMHGTNASAYLRLPFEFEGTHDLDSLTLRMRYNDGFVAYLNGMPVTARNASAGTAGGVVADSAADWSYTGQQGLNNWYYGFYDRGADLDGIYNPVSDFNSTSVQWTWNGGAWVLGPANPPWDMISAGGWHPNGTNSGSLHWAIRRWISTVSGPVTCRLQFAKENTACGSGTTLRVLQNGAERFSWTVAYNDAAGLSTNLVLNSVFEGDYIDFALDPRGTDGSQHDSCDGSTFSASIEQSPSEGSVWNSSATAARSALESSTPEEINLSIHRDLLVQGTNTLAIHGLNCAPDDPDFLILPELVANYLDMGAGQQAYFTSPTPGSANGSGSLTIGPIVSDVEHWPLAPRDADDLSIRARITPSLRAVGTVNLRYRVMYGSETNAPMFDDGNHGDGGAGDSIYGVRIPAGASTPGQMVRYYILASDIDAQETRAPAFQSPTRSPQYFGTVVFDTALTNSRLPVFHWFLQNPGSADSDATARCSVFYNGQFYDNVGANIHGQSTRGFPKKSYDFDFNPGYNFRWSASAPNVGDLNLLTTWADKSHMRNALAHETYRDAGAPSHFAFPVRVQQNGAFFSVANIVESGDNDFLRRLGLDDQGALYKMYNSAESVSGAEKKTRKTEGTADLQALITGMTQSTATARQTYLFDNLNVPEMVDFLAAKIITADTDCCHKNYYLYRDSDGTGEWQAMPWDVDLSFGRVWTCGSPCYAYYDETIYTNQSITVGSGNRIFSPIYDTPSTRQMFLRRLRSLMDQLFQPPWTPATNDFYRLKTLALRDQIAPDAALDLAKWGTWSTTENITQAVNRIWNEFLPGRRAYLFRTLSVTNRGEIPESQATNIIVQLHGLEYRPASGNPLEEWLSITNANSVAVDISDWRLDGGARFAFKPGTVIPARSAVFVSPDVKAFRKRTASPKGGEQRLVVGPYSGNLSAWGESLTLADAAGRLVSSNNFVGSPSPAQRYLRITELFYNPDPLATTNLDPQLYEFIELRNIGPATLDLQGVRFTEGVQFAFSAGAITSLEPGARVLVVADTNAFAVRYGPGLPVAGQYNGKLDSGGERLRLEDAYGEKILDFTYSNTWYPITDGHGYSLVIVDDTISWTLWGEKTSWRPNGVLGGAPGSTDPAPAVFAPVVINEVLAHTDPPLTDSIELYNPTGTNVNVGNWYLTDDFDAPRKFRIPDPHWIPPYGFVEFTAADFNVEPGSPSSFLLSSEGDDVWLFASDAGSVLTGYVQGMDFGATENGVSVGRHVNSVGDVDNPAQALRTMGGTNAGPLVGPVVISEIMYHPPPGASSNSPASYIELANIAVTSTPLFYPTQPTNTWRLRNAVDFDFPTNVVMPVGGRLLVVGFDPLTNSAVLAAFRALYGVSDIVPIHGPWEGRLGNAGETVELKKPDAWNTNGVPYVMVEKVKYQDRDPWPAIADGSGASLQRRVLSSYANEPTNWFASTPTAGAPNQPNTIPVVQLSAPANGSTYQAPTNVSLHASASDADGVVLRVEFFAGAVKIGETTATPFSLTWTNPPPGTHSLTARAVDDRLGTADSAPVSITVNASPPSIALTAPADRSVVLLGTSLPIAAAVQDGHGSIDRVAFYAGNLLLSEMLAPPYTNTWSSPAAGTFPLTATAVSTWGLAATSAVVTVAFTPGTNTTDTLVATGSVWRYLDDGSDPSTNATSWISPNFDDRNWEAGAAELGYGDRAEGRPEATEISYGGDASKKHRAYYFRHTFTVTNAASFRDLSVSLMRDDGAIVYLNGSNIFRTYMPADPVNFQTRADNVVSGVEEYAYVQQGAPASLLLEGANVLAVEVHQCADDSSDVSFDLSLTGTRVLLAPAILAQPASRRISPGQSASFTVDAGGTAPLAYIWRRNGIPVSDGTDATLVITDAGSGDAGDYQVLVTNLLGYVMSTVASLSFSNLPPVPGADGLLVAEGQATSVAAAILLTNDSDPEFGPLILADVAEASQAGAAVSRLNGQITYQPLPGFLGTDEFTYTVTDNGGLSAQGRVAVLVYRGTLPPAGRLIILPEGAGYRVLYGGTPGRTVQLQRSMDLLDWTTLLQTATSSHGVVDYLESAPPTGGAYYRACEL